MVVTNTEYLRSQAVDASKIGEGKYREVFRHGDKVIKLLKPEVVKDYRLFCVNFPISTYTRYRFGIADFNEFEHDVYQGFIARVPVDLRDSFSHIHSVKRVGDRSILVADLVVNDDGSISKPLSNHGCVEQASFWSRLADLEEILVEEQIPLLDIHAGNIIVKETDEGPVPVLIDFKRCGAQTYPFQLSLCFGSGIVKKMSRKFQRLKETYCP